ncbi:MAG: serine/threonine-protein kinase [Polyangiaceae bacterium]
MQIGDRVGQRYVLEAEAGAGGMGVVYRAKDLVSKAPVAVKVLRTHDPMSLARFRREAEVLARLRHPRVVTYFAHGETATGEPYLAMEWLEGESLKERLARGPMPLEETLAVGIALTDALAAAHALPVVHRDVKPANVFLLDKSTANVKLLDLGVARLRAEGQTLTETGAMIGTPSYMSPEQARGVKDIDARSDLFALGCVLYCCAALKPPFADNDSMVTLLKLTTEEAPPLTSLVPDVSPRFAKLVHWLLAPEKEDRPSDAKAVQGELEAIRAELASVSSSEPTHKASEVLASAASAPPTEVMRSDQIPTAPHGAPAAPPSTAEAAKPLAPKWQTDATASEGASPAARPVIAEHTKASAGVPPAPTSAVEVTVADSRVLARGERNKTWLVMVAVAALVGVVVIAMVMASR